MRIQIKEKIEPGSYQVNVPLYLKNKNGQFGLDFDSGRKQLIFFGIALWEAKEMIKDLTTYITTLNNRP